MKKYCYFNGEIIDESIACVNLYDLGILRGYGVFDFMCTAPSGKPFLWEDHWQRLQNSAKSLQLDVPVSKDEYESVINQLVEKNAQNYSQMAIRTVLTAGVSTDGFSIDHEPTFYIVVQDLAQLLPSESMYHSGATIITHEFTRDNHASKTTNYIEAIRLQKQKRVKGAVEVLYHSDGNVLECTTSNIFVVKDGVLYTPDKNILLGITRKIVIALAGAHNIEVVESDVTLDQLRNADEVFITGSAKHVLPITHIDEHQVANGNVGAVTRQVIEIYQEYYQQY